jgi:glycerophosphoryl diester phosphodiesterase
VRTSITSNRFRELLRATRARPLIVAHRGDSFYAPENTLEAARIGWETGADAWEFDVQLSRDGVPVVIHDESLLRTTDVARRFAGDPRVGAGFLVSHFDRSEIDSLDAGSWFLDPMGGSRTAAAFGTFELIPPGSRARFGAGDVRVPTLAEALDLTNRLDWLANVELKSYPNTEPRLLDATLAVIDETGSASRVLLSSFDHADVARVARLRPDIATGVLTATPLFRPDEYVRERVLADTYHPSALVLGAGSDRYLSSPSPHHLRVKDLVRLRQRGVPVLAYTVNDTTCHGLAMHLAEAGVSGFFTDDPRRLIDAFLID